MAFFTVSCKMNSAHDLTVRCLKVILVLNFSNSFKLEAVRLHRCRSMKINYLVPF